MAITALFFDLGGVLLTNGWDRASRRAVIDDFGLDWEEFSDRHEFVSEAFETGRMSLDQYLERTVFYRDRPFSQDEFRTVILDQSQADEEALAFAADLKASGRYLMATLNNESGELNQHRIEKFRLRDYFDVFLSSSILGLKKPDARIYRLAMNITQRRPEECLFVDDRSLNVECAADEGFHAVQFHDVGRLQADLAARGVTW